jgi:hypothetical protein
MLLAAAFSLWMLGALVYDGPGAAIAFIAMLLLFGIMLKLRFRCKAWLGWGACMAAGLAWWLSLKPPRDAHWQADVAQVATAQIDGDVVTFHNVRDFEYRSETDFTPSWITRKVKLSSLTGVDIAINYWGSPWMAHPVVSFQFSDAPPLAFSIETRKQQGQSYSAIGGLYRQFSLTCIVAEERDVLGVRAVHRKGEDVYLYRTTLPPDKARIRLLEYVATINSLAKEPRWYNAITTNCTTAIRSQNTAGDPMPWDWRILVNGKADEMLYARGAFRNGKPSHSFAEFRQRSMINHAASEAAGAPDFSLRIRTQAPSFCTDSPN